MSSDKEVSDKLYACRSQHEAKTAFADWYVGVASDPRDRLFRHHGVNEAAGAWAFEEAESAKAARRIARSFHDGAGFAGELGESDPNALYVYIYLKTRDTRE
jgi:hypothetical protein